MIDTIKYSIIDTEVLTDYFSLQIENEMNDSYANFEIFKDEDFYSLYKMFSSIKHFRAMYAYSVNYDKTILNCMFKMIENGETGILEKLRHVSDLLIKDFNYFRLNFKFWEILNKMDICSEFDTKKIVVKNTILNDDDFTPVEKEFTGTFYNLFGKSKLFKKLTINEVPRILYYYNVKKDGTIRPSISLKKLQLIREGKNVKFDFGKYKSIKQIKADGEYGKFKIYAKNDVKSLKNIFLEKPLDDIKQRIAAVEAVRQIKPDFTIDESAIYSENNTALICAILKLKQPNKNVDIDYSDYIKTNNKTFNRFVNFVNDSKHVEKDKTIKKMFKELHETKDYDDDIKIENDVLVGSVDEVNINGTIIKIGLGGCHGAIQNYRGDNLLHLDYRSQYPSIILQYKELFRNIIDVDLYESIYNLRNFEVKPELKALYKEQKLEGLSEVKRQEIDEQIKELSKLEKGLKLILNSAYGLINSNFELPISCKVLGRFICLKGQSMLINLAEKLVNLSNEIKLINVNTDGLIVKAILEEIIHIVEKDKDGYFVLGVDKIKFLHQEDVNSYIKVLDNGKVSRKGRFNIKEKQSINKNENLSVNRINAINNIVGKKIAALPVYFDSKWIDKEDTSYYLTTKDKGSVAIKTTKKPIILTVDNQKMYFTDNEKDADISEYIKFSDLTRKKIENFDQAMDNTPYIEHVLNSDSDENIKLKRKTKRELAKILGTENIGLTGFMGKAKANSFYPKNNPIKPLVHYTMTDILKSVESCGLSVHNYLIIDVDLYDRSTGNLKENWQKIKGLLDSLKSKETFETWNNKTDHSNRKFVFKSINYKLDVKEEFKDYVEILEKGTIWSLETSDIVYSNNSKQPQEFNLDDYLKYFY